MFTSFQIADEGTTHTDGSIVPDSKCFDWLYKLIAFSTFNHKFYEQKQFTPFGCNLWFIRMSAPEILFKQLQLQLLNNEENYRNWKSSKTNRWLSRNRHHLTSSPIHHQIKVNKRLCVNYKENWKDMANQNNNSTNIDLLLNKTWESKTQ